MDKMKEVIPDPIPDPATLAKIQTSNFYFNALPLVAFTSSFSSQTFIVAYDQNLTPC